MNNKNECFGWYRSRVLIYAMRKDLDMALVRAFLTVVEAGGVTRAAAALGMSQAAASQQIKRLEEALDCRLFMRQGRGLALAPAASGCSNRRAALWR
jgi:molybdenum-dependent DNA-binding transcriptional regulator ModE